MPALIKMERASRRDQVGKIRHKTYPRPSNTASPKVPSTSGFADASGSCFVHPSSSKTRAFQIDFAARCPCREPTLQPPPHEATQTDVANAAQIAPAKISARCPGSDPRMSPGLPTASDAPPARRDQALRAKRRLGAEFVPLESPVRAREYLAQGRGPCRKVQWHACASISPVGSALKSQGRGMPTGL